MEVEPPKHDVISMPTQQYTNTNYISLERYHLVVSIMLIYLDQIKMFGENLCCRRLKIDKIFWGDLPYFALKCDKFLAHPSRRLEWAIVIAHCPSSVRRPSSVNFHIFDFFSRTTWWILMKLFRDEVLMVPYKCCCFSARSAQRRIQGGAKNRSRGSPSSRDFFFRLEDYSHKPNA